MKNGVALLLLVFAFQVSFAQKTIRNADGSYYKQCIHFEETKPLSELVAEHPSRKKSTEHREAKDGLKRKPWNLKTALKNALQEDPTVQTTNGTEKSTGTLANFEGTNSTLGYDPLDPTGMVGTNYYVQAVNSNYQIFNKNGTAASAPIDFTVLFPNSYDDGDPVVLYDKFADRWVITEFMCQQTNPFNCTKLLFAVSKTNNPLGAYYIYTFEPDAGDNADYPKYSIWSDGYYETCNCSNSKVTVYERNKMLLGDNTAGFLVIPSIDPPNNGFFCPQTLFADGQLPPAGSPQYLFYFTDDSWTTGMQDMVHIYKITTDWVNHSGSFTAYDSLLTQPFNSLFSGGFMKDIAQPGTSKKLDGLEGFPAYRIPYFRWTNYNVALMCHPVNLGTTAAKLAGVRWYEFHQDASTQKWSIYQQGTYGPADGVNRWNASIGMDNDGNIGLAYSVSSASSVYPGIRFTGRRKCDTLGLMTMVETVAVNGGASWTSDNRWGDYSHMSLDPTDGLTFWNTNQYVDSSHNLTTRIFSFKVPSCPNGINDIKNKDASLKAYYSGNNNLSISAENLPTNEPLQLAVFDIQGKLLADKKVFPINYELNTEIQVPELPSGIYYIRIGNMNFQRIVKIAKP